MLLPMCMQSLATIGCEMKKKPPFANLITTTPTPTRRTTARTTFVVIGDPFPGTKNIDIQHVLRFVYNEVKLCVQMYKCQHSMAHGYLVELCRPVSSIVGHQYLWSADRVSAVRPTRQTVDIRDARSVMPVRLAWNSLSLSLWPSQRQHTLSLCLLSDTNSNISTVLLLILLAHRAASAFVGYFAETRYINVLHIYCLHYIYTTGI